MKKRISPEELVKRMEISLRILLQVDQKKVEQIARIINPDQYVLLVRGDAGNDYRSSFEIEVPDPVKKDEDDA